MRKCSHLCQIRVDTMLIQLVNWLNEEKPSLPPRLLLRPLELTDPTQEKLVVSCADKEGRK